MKSSSSKTAVLVLGVALVFSGCASKVKQVQTPGELDPAELREGSFAIGGFVLGDRAELDRASFIAKGKANDDPLVQTAAWAPILYDRFLSVASPTRVWPWPTVEMSADSVSLAAVHEYFRRGGVLSTDVVRTLSESLSDIRYLVLARIDANSIETGENTPVSLEDQMVKDGRDVHARSMGRTIKTRRTVKVTLEIYDLENGLTVWSGQVERKDTELYANQPTVSDDGLKVEKPIEEGAPPEIQVGGSNLRAPGLDPVLGQACEALVRELAGGTNDRQTDSR